MHFKLDAESLRDQVTWEDIEIIEGRKFMQARPILAKFAVDDRGRPIPYAKALQLLGQTPLKEIGSVLDEFSTVFRTALLNPTTGDESSKPFPQAEASPSGGSS